MDWDVFVGSKTRPKASEHHAARLIDRSFHFSQLLWTLELDLETTNVDLKSFKVFDFFRRDPVDLAALHTDDTVRTKAMDFQLTNGGYWTKIHLW